MSGGSWARCISLQNCFYLEEQTAVIQCPGVCPSRWFCSGHPSLSYRVHHLARLVEWHLLCIPMLLQHLRVIWTRCSWYRAEELSSSRTSSLHLGMAARDWNESPCPSPERRGKWDRVCRQSGEEKRVLLCSVQPTHPGAVRHRQPFWHGGPIENAILHHSSPLSEGVQVFFWKTHHALPCTAEL